MPCATPGPCSASKRHSSGRKGPGPTRAPSPSSKRRERAGLAPSWRRENGRFTVYLVCLEGPFRRFWTENDIMLCCCCFIVGNNGENTFEDGFETFGGKGPGSFCKVKDGFVTLWGDDARVSTNWLVTSILRHSILNKPSQHG